MPGTSTRRTLRPQTSVGKTASDDDASLSRTIENEIIPRLLLAHSLEPDGTLFAALGNAGFVPGKEEVAELTRLLLEHDVAVAASYVQSMREQGASLGSLFLALLAPAAQLVGDWWREDQCDFTHVSLALSRLQHLLRDLNAPAETDTLH